MREATARALADLFLRQSAEQNELLKSVEGAGPHEDFLEARNIIGKTMGALYLDALRPLFQAHPGLKPEGFS